MAEAWWGNITKVKSRYKNHVKISGLHWNLSKQLLHQRMALVKKISGCEDVGRTNLYWKMRIAVVDNGYQQNGHEDIVAIM